MEYKEIITDLAKKVANKKLIGNELIEFLYDEQFENELHKLTDRAIIYLARDTLIAQNLKYYLIVSLSYIAMKEYDNSFWPYVEKFYEDSLKQIGSVNLMENSIREMISEFIIDKTNSGRQIDYLISNSIVPRKHLDDFFEFVFDIYKINFEYSLPENYQNDLFYIYRFLRDRVRDDKENFEIEVTKKTYKLRMGTLNIIKKQIDVESLVLLTSRVLKIIDQNYYNENIDLLKNEYYKYGFIKWNEAVSTVEKIKSYSYETREKNSKWKPKFKYDNGKIILETPRHIIPDYESKHIDPNTIKISLYNDDKLIYRDEKPCVEKGIGILKLSSSKVNVEFPLKKLRYIVSAGEEIIYDSKEALYRNSIFFNYIGDEIKKYKSYQGNSYICYLSSEDSKINFKLKKEGFCIGTSYITVNDIFYFDDEIVSFSDVSKPGIFGEEYNKVYAVKDDKKIKIYHGIEAIIVETKEKIDNIGVVINGKLYREEKYSCIIDRNELLTYIKVYIKLDDGLYNLKIINRADGKKINGCEFDFIIDKNFEYKLNKLEDNLYKIDLNSNIGIKDNNNNVIEYYMLNTNEEPEPNVFFNFSNEKYRIYLNLNIPMYKIDNGMWNEFNKNIFRKDIKDYSSLCLKGIEYDYIEITDEYGNFIRSLECDKDVFYIGALKNLYDRYDKCKYVDLLVIKNENVIDMIKVYFHAVYDSYNSYIFFDKKERKIKFKINYEGKFRLRVMVSEKNNALYKSNNDIIKNKEYKTSEIKSFKKCIVTIFEESDELFERAIPIYTTTILTYSKGDLVGKIFYIEKAKYSIFNADKEIINEKRLFNTFIKFMNYNKEKNEYIGKVFQIRNGVKIDMNNIYPLYIKVNEELDDLKIQLEVHDMNGENIMLDWRNNTILDSLESNSAADIMHLIISVQERRRNESDRTNKIYRK